MKAAPFDLTLAASLDEAVAAMAGEDGARPMAGGCSLGPMLNLRLARPSHVVDLRRVGELRAVRQSDTHLELGAGWTHGEIEDGLVPDVTAGLMRRVAHGIAYRAVRNRGTIGGSLAHADPAADWVTTLTALDAVLVVRGSSGRRQVAIGDFLIAAYTTALEPGEVLEAVRIPRLSPSARTGYHKNCRKVGEFAKAIGAVIHDPARGVARVVCGAVEAPPILLPQASAALLSGDGAGAIAAATAEVEAALAEHDAGFRAVHVVAVERALKEAGQ